MSDSSDDDNLSTISGAKASRRGSSASPSPASSSPSSPRSEESSPPSRESKAPETAAAEGMGNEEKHVDVNVGKDAGRVAFLSSKEEEMEGTRFSNHRQLLQYEENDDSEGESDDDLLQERERAVNILSLL